jgi:uncharacterized membrane protein
MREADEHPDPAAPPHHRRAEGPLQAAGEDSERHHHRGDHYEWVLKQNCSLSPRQVGCAYGCLSLVVLCVGLGFASANVWYVLPFSIVEIGAVGGALLYYARHATDRERIALEDGALTIERMDGRAVESFRLDPCWTRITLPETWHAPIRLESRGIQVEVGRYVSDELRQQVAREIKSALRQHSLLS